MAEASMAMAVRAITVARAKVGFGSVAAAIPSFQQLWCHGLAADGAIYQ